MSQNTTSFNLGSQINQTRTVLDILWSCLFAIFACTWTVQHLNVPPQRDEESDPGWKGELKYGLRNFWRSAKWMVITMLAPEALITLNFGQLVSAMRVLKKLKGFAKEDGVPWSLTHCLFANMGGFVVREYAPERVDALQPLPAQDTKAEARKMEVAEIDSQSRDGIQAVNDVSSDGKNESSGNIEAQPRPKPICFFLLAHEIMHLREQNILKLPYITRDEIMDKGKSDNLGRLIAIAQVLWLVVQMIVRTSRHLEVSQLEIGTSAFASCAVVLYALNWHKPKGVGVPLTLWSFSGPSNLRESLTAVSEWVMTNDGWLGTVFEMIPGKKLIIDRAASIPNHHRYALGLDEGKRYIETDDFNRMAEFYFLMLSSIVFGAIHFAALHSTFPSWAEKVAWGVSSGICTGGIPLLYSGLVGLVMAADALEHFSFLPEVGPMMVFMSISITVLYILARLFLIVELFRTLFFLPSSAFVATWVSSVPHVS
jgi:hypothetical protein